MRKRVRDSVDEWARRTPQALALLVPGRTAATYQFLSDQLTEAGRLLRLLGIAGTDRVAIVVPDGPEALTAFLAVSDVATAAPINPSLLKNEFEAHLLNVRATSLVTSLELDSPAVRAAVSLGLLVLRLRTGDGPAGAFSLERLAASRESSETCPGGFDTICSKHRPPKWPSESVSRWRTGSTLARVDTRGVGATRGFEIRDERGQAITWGSSHSRQFAAIMAYRPQVRTGRVLVVRARARPLAGPHEGDLGWHRKVSGPLSVTCAPGSHETFLREPYVQVVATSIRQHIDRAMATGDGAPLS